MTKAIWGWGGFKVVYGTETVTFDTAFSTLGFEKETISKRLIDGQIYEKLRGFRAYLNAEIFNYDDGDSTKIQTLISIINNSMADNSPIIITPKYDAAYTSWTGTFRLDSKLQFEDIAKNIFAGQSIKLDFIGAVLLPSMPDNVSNPDEVLRTYDSTDTTNLRVYDSSDSTAYRKAE